MEYERFVFLRSSLERFDRFITHYCPFGVVPGTQTLLSLTFTFSKVSLGQNPMMCKFDHLILVRKIGGQRIYYVVM